MYNQKKETFAQNYRKCKLFYMYWRHAQLIEELDVNIQATQWNV